MSLIFRIVGKLFYNSTMPKNKIRDFPPVFWVHAFLFAVSLTLPFWLNWKLIVIGIILFELQFVLIKDCFLTEIQFGKGSPGFWYFYITKYIYHHHLNPTITNIFVRVAYPIVLIISAYMIQVH